MKSFIDMLKEEKAYTKKGKMFIFKKPVGVEQSGKTFLIVAMGKDANGNPLMRVEFVSGKKKSVQIPYSLSLSVDQVVKNGLDKKEAAEMIGVIY